MAEIENAFKVIFPTRGNAEASKKGLRDKGLTGELKGTPIRGIIWRVFLEVLPPYVDVTEWPQRLAASRKNYDDLCEKFQPDEDGSSESFLEADPLSQDPDSPWAIHFQDNEHKKEIMKDIDRTYPEYEFFQTEETQKHLLHILFIWTKLHPELGYKQGMHELLAPIYYVLYTEAKEYEKLPADKTPTPLLQTIVDKKFVEHDSYALFDALMHSAADFFVAEKPSIMPTSTKREEERQQEKITPMVARCRKVQDVILRQKDPQLHQHLTNCRIEPQIYALRWLRILFSREFRLDDLLIIWDAVFACGRSLVLADFICVAMLMYIRNQLLPLDELMTMKRLLKYPPVEDVTVLVVKAVELWSPKSAQPKASPTVLPQPPTGPSSAARPQRQAGQMQRPAQRQQQQRYVPPANHSSSGGGFFDFLTGSRSSRLEAEVQQKDAQLAKARQLLNKDAQEKALLAVRVERIVFTLSNQFAANPELGNNEEIVACLAELKQIHAVLSGLIDGSGRP